MCSYSSLVLYAFHSRCVRGHGRVATCMHLPPSPHLPSNRSILSPYLSDNTNLQHLFGYDPLFMTVWLRKDTVQQTDNGFVLAKTAAGDTIFSVVDGDVHADGVAAAAAAER